MGGFDTTLDCLMSSSNRDALRLLGHLLSRGDMSLRRRTVARLLETTDGRRQSLLLQHFRSLGHELETEVLDSVGRLGPGLRFAMSSRSPGLQGPVLDVLAETRDYSLAYLAGEATTSADEAIRARAVDVLWRWAVDLRRREMTSRGPADATQGSQLDRRRRFVLEGLQRAFSLRTVIQSPRVLRAAAMLADDSAAWFWGAMGIRRDTRRQALFGLIAERLEPEMFAFAVRALGRESTGADAAELLRRRLPARDLELLLREFLCRPRLSQTAVRRLRDVPWLTAGETSLAAMPAELVATALALAARSGAPAGQVAALCATLATDHADPEARRVAVDAMAHCGDPAAESLRLVAAEAPRPTAALAILHLVRRGAFESPSEAAVANLLRDWWDLAESQRREVARGAAPALRAKPDLLRRHLSYDGTTRAAAVTLVRIASVADAFADQLAGIAMDESDGRIRSAALAAVAESRAAGVAEILARGLRSADPRVRANAVEGLDRREADADVFLPLAGDPNNRVRANAARALIERNRPEGREALRALLKAGEAERLSALWVFSKTHPNGFATTARLLARQDPSRTVRRKAADLLASVQERAP